MDIKKEKKNQITQIENQLKKALADYINLEKDIDRRVELRVIQQKAQVAREMMDILDSLHLAIKSKETLEITDAVKSWIDGVTATLGQIENSLENIGVCKIDLKVGDEFDSSLHEAVGVVAGGKKNTVSEIVGPGYVIGAYVVRPARVIIFQGEEV